MGRGERHRRGRRLDVLATLVEAYEDARWPLDDLYPVEAIEAAMAHDGHSRGDLAGLIGESRASEVLRRKRLLTLGMIRKISAAWRAPERVLVRDYPPLRTSWANAFGALSQPTHSAPPKG